MKMMFLLPVVAQARYHKRVNAMQSLGGDVQIFAFERDYYPGKHWQNGYTSLGTIAHGRYFERIISILRAFPLVYEAAKSSDAIYTFGLDMLLLGWLASRFHGDRLRIIYEVGDIRDVLIGNSLYSRCLRWLERFLLRRTDLLVVTSKAFIFGYFRDIQGLMNLHYQVIENKLSACTPVISSMYSRPNYGNGIEELHIGYFGLIRCYQSWDILNKLVDASHGRIRLHVHGIFIGIPELEEGSQVNPFITYSGSYVVPDDLPAMYEQVDMVWACYPYQGDEIGNWCWARTNRFYEACCFQKPMFVQKDTEDGQVVENLQLGVVLDLADIEGSIEKILDIKPEDIELWRQNLLILPKEIYTLTNEHELLLSHINETNSSKP